jgi:hypothetical protein
MSRAPKQESIPLSAAISPYGVIDFRSNADTAHHSDLAAAMATHATSVAPGVVVGGPPAYLEAHGIRYVPSMDPLLGADLADSPGNNPLLVPMCDPDRDGSAPLDSAAAYVSPRELNSRVDDRIRRFMELQSSPAAGRGGDAGNLAAAFAAQTTEERLKSLRRDCEMAAQAASAGKAAAPGISASAAGAASRARKATQEAPQRAGHQQMNAQAPVVAYGSRRASRRPEQFCYDF